MKSSYLCLIGIVAAAMAFPGCAMNDLHKGVYDATHDTVEALKAAAGGKQEALKAAKKAVSDAEASIKAIRAPSLKDATNQQIIAALVMPNDDLHNCGIDERARNKLSQIIGIANSDDVYAAIASELFLPLFEGMGDKLNGKPGFELEHFDIPYNTMIAAASDQGECANIGQLLLDLCSKLALEKDYIKQFIGLFGNRVATALIENPLKLSDVTNGVDVLKSLLIMSGRAFDGNDQPSTEDVEKFGTFKTLLDIAPDFMESLKAKGGLKGLVKDTQNVAQLQQKPGNPLVRRPRLSEMQKSQPQQQPRSGTQPKKKTYRRIPAGV